VDHFALAGDDAREWIAEAIVSWETRDGDRSEDDVPIGLGWEPRDPGEEVAVYLLVRSAQTAGVLRAPRGMSVEFEYVDDGLAPAYRWLLAVTSPATLHVVSGIAPVRGLGTAGALGVQAAMGVLREAVREANRLLEQLADYAAAADDLPSEE
jgi:hypothetical protein